MADLPLRLAVRMHCAQHACAQHGGVHDRVPQEALIRGYARVLTGYPRRIPLLRYTRDSTQRGMLFRSRAYARMT